MPRTKSGLPGIYNATPLTLPDGAGSALALDPSGRLQTAVGISEVAYTTTTAQAVASTDVSNYAWVSVQQTSTGGSSVTTFQVSNDNTNWVSLNLVGASSGTSATSSTTSANSINHGPLTGRYFRLNVTGIASGTTAGTIEFFTSPKAMQSIGVNAAQSGNWQLAKQNTSTNSPSIDAKFGSTVSSASKGSAGNVFAIDMSSVDTGLVYFQLHNKATVPVSTDVPIYSFPIGAGTATSPSRLTLGESFFGTVGKNFATGIAWGVSTTNATYTAASTAANYNVHVHYV